jgi:hypothetical protein
MVSIELGRAFKCRRILPALLLGMGICIWHYLQNVFPLYEIQRMYTPMEGELYYPITVFSTWIGGNAYTIQQYLYFLLVPIIAVLPYGGSYYEDLKSGEYKNIITRIEKVKYLGAKYIAVFLSAGFVVVLPLIINLLLTAITVPSLLPQAATYAFGIGNMNIGYELFYRTPYVYIGIYLIFDFVFSGIIAGAALAAATFAGNICIVWVTPFVMMMFLMVICSMMNKAEYAPVYYLNPGIGQENILGAGIQILFVLIYTFFVYYVGEKNSESI